MKQLTQPNNPSSNTKLLRSKLTKAQAMMKLHTKKHRSDMVFNVCDWVHIKLQPCKQLLAKLIRNQKLSELYYGPFQITQRIGSMPTNSSFPNLLRFVPFSRSLYSKLTREMYQYLQRLNFLQPSWIITLC